MEERSEGNSRTDPKVRRMAWSREREEEMATADKLGKPVFPGTQHCRSGVKI